MSAPGLSVLSIPRNQDVPAALFRSLYKAIGRTSVVADAPDHARRGGGKEEKGMKEWAVG